MIAPWKFRCSNYHAVCEAHDLIDIPSILARSWPRFPVEGIFGSRQFIATFVNMEASITPAGDTEVCNEILIKVVTSFEGNTYLLPVFAAVDGPVSMTRGNILGYNKYFGEFFSERNELAFNSQAFGELKLDISHIETGSSASGAPTYPHLLYREFDFGQGISAHGLSTVCVEQSTIEASNECEINLTENSLFVTLGLPSFAITRGVFDIQNFVVTGSVAISDVKK